MFGAEFGSGLSVLYDRGVGVWEGYTTLLLWTDYRLDMRCMLAVGRESFKPDGLHRLLNLLKDGKKIGHKHRNGFREEDGMQCIVYSALLRAINI